MNEESQEVFDPDLFLQQEFDTALDTKISLFDEGDYNGAILVTIGKARKITPEERPDRPDPKPFAVVDVVFELQGMEEKAAELGRNLPVHVRAEIMLDLDETGRMDARKGKNTKLGALREMNGLNVPGERFSMSMLHGTGPYLVKLIHKDDDRDVKNNIPPADRRKYERIVAWARQ